MIQLITDNGIDTSNSEIKYVVNDFSNIESFDEYNVNIIDLTSSNIWYNRDGNKETINMIKDIKHLKKIVENSITSETLILIPQNIIYYWYKINGKYVNEEELKNILKLVKGIINENIYYFPFDMSYERSLTIIKNQLVTADFCFDTKQIEETKWSYCKVKEILKSNKSKRINTIKIDNKVYVTTLDLIGDINLLNEFLKYTKIYVENKVSVPGWAKEINILDDYKIKGEIANIDNKLDMLLQKKKEKQSKLEQNSKVKSILYETDKKLQFEVIKILNEMLDYEDNNFVDKMEEDYRIKKENITFIIETKGLSRNIKGEDISKTINHVEMYEDKLEEDNIKENVKGIYIVATQRNKKIEEREKTPDRQLKLAERNNILIIRTEILLKLYENFKNGKIKTKEIIESLMNRTGELKLD